MKESSENLAIKLDDHIKIQKLLKSGDRILIACSGGADSTALFSLLNDMSKKWKWKLGLIHFNHRFRGREASRDERAVRKLAKKYRIPFYFQRRSTAQNLKKTRVSTEEFAREIRYEFFLKIAKHFKSPKIVTAHTQDDQAETILMRVIQGTGIRGLLGIREKMKFKGVTFVRPLLPFSKSELLNYLKYKKISFCYDMSNDSLQFLRNRVRAKLIPYLSKNYNPRTTQALARIPLIVKEENAAITEFEKIAWKHIVGKRRNKSLELNRTLFEEYPTALKYRLLERALKKVDERSGLSFEAWRKLQAKLDLLNYRCSFPKNVEFSLTKSLIKVYKKG